MDLKKNGLIRVGRGGVVGKRVMMAWNDPFPWEEIAHIGFGSWDAPIEVRNIRVEFAEQTEGEEELDDEEEEDDDDDENIEDLEAEGEDLALDLDNGGDEE